RIDEYLLSTAHRFKGAKSRADKEALADVALQLVGLSMAEIKGRFSHELSGVQLQRIAVDREYLGLVGAEGKDDIVDRLHLF
ncbi:hypothetical protein AB9F38_35445, partial [Rhizobium leguminosarum]